MTTTLGSGLIGGGLQALGAGAGATERARGPERPPPAAADQDAPDASAAASLRAQPVVRYAVAEDAERYRRLMRALYLEHQAFGLRLRPEQVGERARSLFGLRLDEAQLAAKLDQLAQWGALDREHDAGLATSAAEWRRNRYTYDVTPAGRLTEELLQRLDDLGHDHGVLDGQRIPAIRDALSKLADGLAAPEPDGLALRALLEQVLGEVHALHAGALAFMKSLGALIRRSEQIGEEEFERTKGTLIDHLQGFRRDRRRWSGEVLEALERVTAAGVERLVELIVACEDYVELPGGATVAEQQLRRRAELERQWRGLRAWFLGDSHVDSPWRALNDNVVDAIRAVIDIAERIIERRTARADRAQAHLRLAGHAASAPPGRAPVWVLAALGLCQPRHFGVPEEDPDQVPERGRTPWVQAPAAPVVAHLRRPGRRTPGTGRGAQVVDLSEARARLAERRRRERSELEAMLTRYAARGPARLSDLATLDEHEFAHLLAWIGRAYEAPAGADGSRRAASSDGRAEIRLIAPCEGRRATIRAPQGRLDTPDFRLEVILG